MEIKPGYKRTEVGIIPKEWDLRGLLTTVRIANGQVDPRKEPYRSMTLVAPDHVESGTGRLLEKRTAAEQHAVSGKYRFNSGDIVYSKIRPYLRKAILADFAGLCSADMYPLKTTADVVGGFILPLLLAHRFTKHAESVSVRSGMPKINRAEMAEFVVALPPPPEQRAIAETLSDVDQLLGGLDQLIAKKRAIKQATMQQLLTGKTRLPGFGDGRRAVSNTEIGELPTDWPVVPVKEMTRSHKQGYYTKDQYVNDGVRLVRITDLLNLRIDYDSMPMLRLRSSDYDLYRIRVGDFLFARSGAIGRYGIVYEDIDAVFGSYIIRFNLESAILRNEFFGYLYETQLVWKQLLSITQGSSNININAANIKSIQIPLPSFSEQSAIVSVLSDMDDEIAALEARRDKTRAIKQGMMQQLLTGRIRLVKTPSPFGSGPG